MIDGEPNGILICNSAHLKNHGKLLLGRVWLRVLWYSRLFALRRHRGDQQESNQQYQKDIYERRDVDLSGILPARIEGHVYSLLRKLDTCASSKVPGDSYDASASASHATRA